MAGFQYYLPGWSRDSITPKEIEAAGLAYAFEKPGRKSVRRVLANGPDKADGGSGQGLVLADPARVDSSQTGIYQDWQTWRKHPTANYYVGVNKNELPGPDDLAREKQIPGVMMELA